MPRLAAAALLLSLAACGRSAANPLVQRSTATPGLATVVRVVDGDTLKVDIAGKSDRVRLIGIDTPESVKPNTPVQCFVLALPSCSRRR
jgi:micrococcal nuclease